MNNLEDFTVGTVWNDSNIKIAKCDNGNLYALNGWNGERWVSCWQVLDESGRTKPSTNPEVEVVPEYDWENCPLDEDGEKDCEQLKLSALRVR